MLPDLSRLIICWLHQHCAIWCLIWGQQVHHHFKNMGLKPNLAFLPIRRPNMEIVCVPVFVRASVCAVVLRMT